METEGLNENRRYNMVRGLLWSIFGVRIMKIQMTGTVTSIEERHIALIGLSVPGNYSLVVQ